MGKNEMRKDYITEERVIIAADRGNRPFCFEKPKSQKTSSKCPFCPGNEPMTIGIESDSKEWQTRAIKNKYPVVEPSKTLKSLPIKPEIIDGPFYSHFPVSGQHEVIVETREHNKEPHELGFSAMKRVIDMYVSRHNKLISNKNIQYVLIFKNRGETAGASIPHPHSQISAFPIIPERIRWEMEGVKKKCAFCEIVKLEASSNRFIHENNSFVAICPYAPKFKYEVWILSKRHVKTISDLKEEEKNDLAEIMCLVLNAMEKIMGNFPFNYVIHQAPKAKDFHFHMEIYPRLNVWAGIEIGSNIYVNPMPPEDAAIAIKNAL